MRYGIDHWEECHACGEFAELCMDCGCCEHCCGNGFDCPSEIEEDVEMDKYFEYYWEETPPKSAKEVRKDAESEGR